MDSFIPTNNVEKVSFYILGDEDNEIDSHVQVLNKELFKATLPIPSGIYSLRLGSTEQNLRCATCRNTKDLCHGHFGHIRAPYPEQSPQFKKELMKWLRVICFKCGLPISEVKNINSINKHNILNEYVKLTRNSADKSSKCINCGELHPYIFKDLKDPIKIMIRLDNGFELRLRNDQIEDILNRITDSTVLKLGKSLESHPNKLIIRNFRVPPNTMRPDIKTRGSGSRSSNNDITTLLKNIMSLIEKLPNIISEETIKENETMLDNIGIHYYNLIKEPPTSAASSKIQGNTGNALASVGSRIPKKPGRIRKNLMGKRVSHMARSVIGGDPYISIDAVGVPLSLAKILQVPEVVQSYNRDRLMIYFQNKDKVYPGCSKIIKKDNKNAFYVGSIDDNIMLENGDTIYRDLIDGDYVAMNRAPSLLYSSISGHIVKVLSKGDTFRLSPNITDSLYGGDYDGDAMNMIVPHSIIARNECGNLCNLKRWFVSYKDSNPSMGVYHDPLIGIFELTRNGIQINKYNTMRLMSQMRDSIFLNKGKSLKEDMYDGKMIVSEILPPINYKKKSGFYNPDYSNFINYDPKDIQVEIKRGKIITGRLDKKSLGQGVSDSIFQRVNTEYGNSAVIDLIYNIQQIANSFLMSHGYTINYTDISIEKSVLLKINDITSSILYESNLLTDKLHQGLITAPIGMTVTEYYESQQMSILQLGDEFLESIIGSIDPESNHFYKLIASGSKGKTINLIQISSSIGPMLISGERSAKLFGYERCAPYFKRFHNTPESRGFVKESYSSGVSVSSFIFQAQEGRYSIINKALSTSITGYQNRKTTKHMESLKVDNLRKVSKGNNVVQCLYGGDGVDIRKVEFVKFGNMLVSDSKFKEVYQVDIKQLDKRFQNANIQKLLDDEFKQLLEDRILFRKYFMKIESNNIKNKLMSDSQVLPVNIHRVIEDTIYNHQEYINENKKNIINIITLNDKVKKLCNDLYYCHYNEIQKHKQMHIPEYVQISFTMFHMYIRSILNIKNLLDNNINEHLLDIIIEYIIHTFKISLIEYGSTIGTIAAQCICEPMTQYVLDSHHRTGNSGANFLTRMKEIFGAKNTDKMEAPMMEIFLKDEYSKDRLKMQEIANNIETMKLGKFVIRDQIFFEDYKQILHSAYKHENTKMIGMFEKHNPNLKVPNDLIKWCIRLEFDNALLIEKNLNFDLIFLKLKEVYPLFHIVYTDENVNNIIMRIYIRSSYFKKTEINHHILDKFINTVLLNTIIRGIHGIHSANVEFESVARSKVNEDGSISTEKVSIIRTNGTNLSEIFNNEYVDPYKTSSNSIIEIQELFGVDAAKQKLIIECRNMLPGPNYKHFLLLADEMTYTGEITNLERSGLETRESGNGLLSVSLSHPLQILESLAINNQTSTVDNCLSSALMLGTTNNVCSNYNQLCMNSEFIDNNLNDLNSLVDEL